MLILMNGQQGVKLPYRRVYGGQPVGNLEIHAKHYEDVVVDGAFRRKVSRAIFRLDEEWPEQFTGLKPDITVFVDGQDGRREVVFFETKTIGSQLKADINQIDRYVELLGYLSGRDWNAKIFYLLSHGHENKNGSIWDSLKKADIPHILWEDVLPLIADSPLNQVFANLGKNITDYATPPEI